MNVFYTTQLMRRADLAPHVNRYTKVKFLAQGAKRFKVFSLLPNENDRI